MVNQQYRKTSGSTNSRDTRSKILESAETEFVIYGFNGASIKRIAERANLTRSNIYYYYRTKQDIYISVLRPIIAAWNADIDSFDMEDNPKETLESYIDSKISLSRQNPVTTRIFANEIAQGAPNLAEHLEVDFCQWVRKKVVTIQSWIDQGKMEPIDPIFLLCFLWGGSRQYIDFSEQIRTVMGHERRFEGGSDLVASAFSKMMLNGCGVAC